MILYHDNHTPRPSDRSSETVSGMTSVASNTHAAPQTAVMGLFHAFLSALHQSYLSLRMRWSITVIVVFELILR